MYLGRYGGEVVSHKLSSNPAEALVHFFCKICYSKE